MNSSSSHCLPRSRLIAVTFDPASISRNANPRIEHERRVAIHDLLDCNSFELVGHDAGPYRLVLGTRDTRLVFNVHNESSELLISHVLPFAALKRIIRDYFIVCDTYYDAVKSASASRIQAIDVERRSLHDEGSRTLIERLSDNINIDPDTGRRLFTLICTLHWKG